MVNLNMCFKLRFVFYGNVENVWMPHVAVYYTVGDNKSYPVYFDP